MKKLISTLLFAGSLSWLALPAAADVQVQDMNVVQADHTAKVHFALVNPDSYITQEGRMTVTLLARKNPESDWQMVQTWPGQQLTLTNHVGTAVFDLDSLHNGVLRQMASYKGWEAKVIVDAGKDIVVQKTFQAFDSASR